MATSSLCCRSNSTSTWTSSWREPRFDLLPEWSKQQRDNNDTIRTWIFTVVLYPQYYLPSPVLNKTCKTPKLGAQSFRERWLLSILKSIRIKNVFSFKSRQTNSRPHPFCSAVRRVPALVPNTSRSFLAVLSWTCPSSCLFLAVKTIRSINQYRDTMGVYRMLFLKAMAIPVLVMSQMTVISSGKVFSDWWRTVCDSACSSRSIVISLSLDSALRAWSVLSCGEKNNELQFPCIELSIEQLDLGY